MNEAFKQILKNKNFIYDEKDPLQSELVSSKHAYISEDLKKLINKNKNSTQYYYVNSLSINDRSVGSLYKSAKDFVIVNPKGILLYKPYSDEITFFDKSFNRLYALKDISFEPRIRHNHYEFSSFKKINILSDYKGYFTNLVIENNVNANHVKCIIKGGIDYFFNQKNKIKFDQSFLRGVEFDDNGKINKIHVFAKMAEVLGSKVIQPGNDVLSSIQQAIEIYELSKDEKLNIHTPFISDIQLYIKELTKSKIFNIKEEDFDNVFNLRREVVDYYKEILIHMNTKNPEFEEYEKSDTNPVIEIAFLRFLNIYESLGNDYFYNERITHPINEISHILTNTYNEIQKLNMSIKNIEEKKGNIPFL